MILGKRTVLVPKPEDMPFSRKLKILTAKAFDKTAKFCLNVFNRFINLA